MVRIWRCMQIFSRSRDGLAKLRESADAADRVAIIMLWNFAVLVLLLCFRFALNIGETILSGIRELR